MTGDGTSFPDSVYRDTVLAPLFDGVREHHAAAMSAINRAHLLMLSETGILAPSEVRAIAAALHQIETEVDIAALSYTGEHEDWFFLVEAELKSRLGTDVGGMLHTARSRNDIDHTVFRMVLREHGHRLMHQALALAEVCLCKARVERDTLIVAYTHGQPAQPSTFGHYLCAALEVLISDIQRLQCADDALALCPMGAAAITTSGFPVDRERMAQLLGFIGPKRNSYGCIASVDYITGWYSAMRLLFLHLGRLIQDMAFWSAFEVGQLKVPDSLVQISSIMPQKRNPVPIEHLRHLCSISAGRCDMVVATMHNTPFTDMNDSEGEVQIAGYAAFDSGGRVLELLARFLDSVGIDDQRVTRNADSACITITELADTLVRQEGLSFRQAHAVAATTAQAVIADGQGLKAGYTAFAKAFHAQTGRASRLDAAAFGDCVSMQHFIRVRDRLGGPAPAALDAALVHYQQEIVALRDVRYRLRQEVEASCTQRELLFAALLEN